MVVASHSVSNRAVGIEAASKTFLDTLQLNLNIGLHSKRHQNPPVVERLPIAPETQRP
jgi:hypothetical protein